MSRVLLMVDNGDGRVKCAKKSVTHCSHSVAFVYGRRNSCGACLGTGWVIGARAPQAARWWLVEAASVDDARAVIAGTADTSSEGRILAQGGRQ